MNAPRPRPSLSVVIPCFNEAPCIPEMAREARAFTDSIQAREAFSQIEIIVVDDGSSDSSPELIGQEDVFILDRLSRNHGYGYALKQGFSRAQGDLWAFLDMDRTYCLSDLVAMNKARMICDADVVFGARSRSISQPMPLIRKVGNSLFTRLTKQMMACPISDVCTGLRLLNADRTRKTVLATRENGLDFSMALTIDLLNSDLSVIEVPVTYRERLGDSKLSWVRDGLQFFRALTGRVYEQHHRRHL